MSPQARRWHRRQRMPPEYTLVLLAVALHHTDKGGCYPTLQVIADHSNISVSTAKRRLQELIDGGWLSKTTATRHGTRRTLYTLHFDRTIEAPRDRKGFKAWLKSLKQNVPDDRPKAPPNATRKEQADFHTARLTTARKGLR